MNIKFLKDFNEYKAGQVLEGCFRNGALELVEKGIAIEVNEIGEPVAKVPQKAITKVEANDPRKEG